MTDTQQAPTDTGRQALIEAFTERVQAVGGLVSRAANIEEAGRIIATAQVPSVTGRYTATAAAVAAYPALRDALAAHGIDMRVAEEVAPEASPSELAASLAGDIGIILAEAGVAETGSFLPTDGTLPARLTGMLADTAFALLPAEAIVPTLDDMGHILARLSAEGRRYLSIVTGPSRTADIERVLTIGVQGPKVLHAIILEHLE